MRAREGGPVDPLAPRDVCVLERRAPRPRERPAVPGLRRERRLDELARTRGGRTPPRSVLLRRLVDRSRNGGGGEGILRQLGRLPFDSGGGRPAGGPLAMARRAGNVRLRRAPGLVGGRWNDLVPTLDPARGRHPHGAWIRFHVRGRRRGVGHLAGWPRDGRRTFRPHVVADAAAASWRVGGIGRRGSRVAPGRPRVRVLSNQRGGCGRHPGHRLSRPGRGGSTRHPCHPPPAGRLDGERSRSRGWLGDRGMSRERSRHGRSGTTGRGSLVHGPRTARRR